MVQRYNASMGGTDRIDQNVSCYRTAIRTRKRWSSIFSWIVDVTVQNAWLIYGLEHRDMSELDFRAWIARTYLKQAEPKTLSSRAKVLASNVLPDVRFDKWGIMSFLYDAKFGNVLKEGCTSRPPQGCVKRSVGLCIRCFRPYHEK